MECPSGIVECWLNTIADFPFRVEHRPGNRHTNADCLSREGAPEPPSDDDDNDTGAGHVANLGKKRITHIFEDNFKPKHLFQHSNEELAQLQANDEDLAALLPAVAQQTNLDDLTRRAGSHNLQTYTGIFEQLTITNGLLRRNTTNQITGQTQSALCLPTILWMDTCLLYTSPSPRDKRQSRMPSSA